MLAASSRPHPDHPPHPHHHERMPGVDLFGVDTAVPRFIPVDSGLRSSRHVLLPICESKETATKFAISWPQTLDNGY